MSLESSTRSKALRINLDTSTYGTIAEIGGGQEVARAFFQAGGASGTVAKTISAYDKTFSDTLYNNGKKDRYVSEKRLLQMLEKEYQELIDTLGNIEKRFFCFANTVEILNYKKDNKGHGWLGVKFQTIVNGLPNIVVVHVNLLENDGLLQQNTLGILGVNLIYACFYLIDDIDKFILSLMDNLDRHRVEINMIRFSGKDFEHVDNRLISLKLVKNNLTNATVLDRYGNICMPGDFLYKKNLLILRGSFRPITYVGFDMLKSSYSLFKKEEGENFSKETTLQLCEITLNNLLETGNFDEKDFLNRVDLLNGMGQNVMVTNFQEFYKLSEYLSSIKINKIRIIVGANILAKLFQKHWYENLNGGILQAMGILFARNVVIYVYPYYDEQQKLQLNTSTISIEEDVKLLYKYLVENKRIVEIPTNKCYSIAISSNDVLNKIKQNDNTWLKLVPKYVSKMILERKLFIE